MMQCLVSNMNIWLYKHSTSNIRLHDAELIWEKYTVLSNKTVG